MTSLRQRRHAETKEAIVEAAFALFARHGFSETAMEHIAAHAGVSRSTLYRRFGSKEEIVLEVPQRWLAAWDTAIAALDNDDSLADAMAAGCLAVANEIDNDSTHVLAAYAALEQAPALQSSSARSADWLERMIQLVKARDPKLDGFDARTIAGAYLGAIDAMMLAWAGAGGRSSVATATHRLLNRMAPILA